MHEQPGRNLFHCTLPRPQPQALVEQAADAYSLVWSAQAAWRGVALLEPSNVFAQGLLLAPSPPSPPSCIAFVPVGEPSGMRRVASVNRFLLPLSERPEYRDRIHVFMQLLSTGVAAAGMATAKGGAATAAGLWQLQQAKLVRTVEAIQQDTTLQLLLEALGVSTGTLIAQERLDECVFVVTGGAVGQASVYRLPLRRLDDGAAAIYSATQEAGMAVERLFRAHLGVTDAGELR